MGARMEKVREALELLGLKHIGERRRALAEVEEWERNLEIAAAWGVGQADRAKAAEAVLKEMKSALARERGGGTPLSRSEYIALNGRAAEVLLDGIAAALEEDT